MQEPWTGLLMSILVRYSEIARIKALPKERRICLGFMLHGTCSAAAYEEFELVLRQSLDAVSMLGRRPLGDLDVTIDDSSDFTMVEFCRDIATLGADEFPVLIGLLHEQFPDALVLDSGPSLPDEEDALQAEMIAELLVQCRYAPPSKEPLVGFRDNGKVLVFGKNAG